MATMMKKKKTKKVKAVSERGRQFRRARRTAGLTVRGLATKIGVSPSAVSAWENAKKQPSAPLVPKLAAALGLTPAALLDILELD